MNPLKPSTSLLCKLGSIIVHTEEGYSPSGHGFDVVVLGSLLSDPEIVKWMEEMRKMAFLPVKRR